MINTKNYDDKEKMYDIMNTTQSIPSDCEQQRIS